MAFQAKISSLRFHHLDIVGWRLKKRTTKGVTGTSGPPSSYHIVAAPLSSQTLGLTSFSLLNHRTLSDSAATLSKDKNMERLEFLQTRDRPPPRKQHSTLVQGIKRWPIFMN